MVILGIEAAARACSAAIFENGRILAEVRSNAGMTHSETLLPMVDRVLALSGKTTEQVDAVALTNGPGSFTGLRIGAATAKGLALGMGKPLIPVGTLQALTYTGDLGDFIRVGIMDARRSQVYTAVYQRQPNSQGQGEDRELLAPSALSLAELTEFLKTTQGPLVFFGDAEGLYRDYFRNELGERYHSAPATLRELSAASVCAVAAEIAEKALAAGENVGIPGDELVIEYLRKSQAEREREERLARESASGKSDGGTAGEGGSSGTGLLPGDRV